MALHYLDPLYLRMYEAGLLDYSKPNYRERYLELSDTEWWPLDEIEQYEPPDYHISGLFPFAMNGLGDRWSWYAGWSVQGAMAVVFSPRGEDVAMGYAPDFSGCVYRLLLEEMSESLLVSYGKCTEEALGSVLRRYADDVSPFLPAPWAETLQTLSRREIQPAGDNVYCLLSREDANAIIRRDLAFDGLDLQFKQYR